MATLQFIYSASQVYDLWSWQSHRTVHQSVHITKRLGKSHAVYLGQLGTRGCKPKHTVIVKLARREEVPILEKEFSVYENRLRGLQGTVVPECYGFFKGKVDGHDLACLLLQYCVGPRDFHMTDKNHQIMTAVCKLHGAGIIHGSLDDGHHIVSYGSSIRLVDFSNVLTDHRCVGAMPILRHPSGSQAGHNGCPELVLMEKIYGLMDLLADDHVTFNTWR